jgi:type VI secretion system secreted protein VgrG
MSGNLSVKVTSDDALDVREFHVKEALSSLFDVTLTVVSDNPDIDFEAVIGQEASFTLHGRAGGGTQARTWSGIAAEMQQIRVEPGGLSTYHLRIVPLLWLTSQRRNHRMFQMKSELDIVRQILGEWGVPFDERITGQYKSRKYRVQYGETDYVFLSRMLEDAGVAFYFAEQDGASKLVLADAPQRNDTRAPAIPFNDQPTAAPDREHVTRVAIGRRIRPGKYTMRDVDYRRPATYPLLASAAGAGGVEQQLERYHYTPGAFLFEAQGGGDTPHADDRGRHRTDEGEGQKLVQKRLAASRGDALTSSFATNVVDLWPGVVMTVQNHPHRAFADGTRHLVTASQIDGARDGEWRCQVEVRSAEGPYYPELRTPKPKAHGVESAVVVGQAGDEIHTDEFGRARVQFHWDREGGMDEKSSCWIPVSQPWGGAGYGGTALPRVGQEVLVGFLGGDPDRPMIVGRVYTNLQKTPYKLPDNKTQSGLKSNSTGGTGGYNEIMMEDSGGQELLRVQAEKDHHVLVKNDERHTVGRDRSRAVQRNEDVTIGNNRTKTVAKNEQHLIGLNHSIAVGVNRSTQVGAIDSTIVGDTHTVMISPPGEGVSSNATSTTITNGKIVLDTGQGFTTRYEGNQEFVEGSAMWIHAADAVQFRTKNLSVFADDAIHLQVGGSSIDIKPDGITIQAALVDIKGTPIKLNSP